MYICVTLAFFGVTLSENILLPKLLEALYCLRTFCSACGYLQLLVDDG